MSEDLAEGEKNFRSAYYVSLGVRAEEKSISYLEGLLKAETVDLEKLKQFCLKHTLPAYYRLSVWKLILGVEPPYSDDDTRQFVRTQKAQQFHDLRHALQVMGRIPGYSPDSTSSSPASSSSPEDFVLIFLLENNKLPSGFPGEMRRMEGQVDLCAVAKAFVELCGPGNEVEAYWMFSSFTQRREGQMQSVGTMKSETLQCLHDVDSTFSHCVKQLSNGLPVNKWFNQCFAAVLPELCLESVWDKVVAGSNAILVYMAAAILLSLKRTISGLRTADELAQILTLNSVPKENFTPIVSQALELWESHGSPL